MNKLFILFLLYFTQFFLAAENPIKEREIIRKQLAGLDIEDMLTKHYLPLMVQSLAFYGEAINNTYKMLLEMPKKELISFLIMEKPVPAPGKRVEQIYKIILKMVFDKNIQFSLSEKLELLNMTIKAMQIPEHTEAMADYIKQNLINDLPLFINTINFSPEVTQMLLKYGRSLNDFKKYIINTTLSHDTYIKTIAKNLLELSTKSLTYSVSKTLNEYLNDPAIKEKNTENFISYIQQKYKDMPLLIQYLIMKDLNENTSSKN